MKCSCGFRFAGPGEFRYCEAFVTAKGKSGIICPICGRAYIDGREVQMPRQTSGLDKPPSQD